MSFIRPDIQGRFSFSHYLLGFGIVLLAFAVLGQIPITISLFSIHPFPSTETLSLLKGKIGEILFLILLTLPFVFGCFALFFVQRIVHGTNWIIQATHRSRFNFRRMSYAFSVWIGISLLSSVINYMIYGNVNWQGFSINNLTLLFVSILFIGIQTVSEELFFRGYFLQAMGRIIKNNGFIVIITGTVFGLVHGWNPEVTTLGPFALSYYVWTGIFLGILVVVEDGLELSIGYHFANNFFASYFITNDWQAFQTPALFKDVNPPYFDWITLIYLVITQLLFAAIVLKKEQWRNLGKLLFKN